MERGGEGAEEATIVTLGGWAVRPRHEHVGVPPQEPGAEVRDRVGDPELDELLQVPPLQGLAMARGTLRMVSDGLPLYCT